MTQPLQEILTRLDELSDDDRTAFDEIWTKRVEAEWLRESAAAREEAAKRGIDQAAIDRTLEAVRHGP